MSKGRFHHWSQICKDVWTEISKGCEAKDLRCLDMDVLRIFGHGLLKGVRIHTSEDVWAWTSEDVHPRS